MVFVSESLGYVTDYLKEMFNRWKIIRLGHILDIIFLPAVGSLFGFWFGFLFVCLFLPVFLIDKVLVVICTNRSMSCVLATFCFASI